MLNLDTLPEMSFDKEMRMLSEWYTEIYNTYPYLELDNLEPSHFSFKTTLPFEKIKMTESARDKPSLEGNISYCL